MSKSLLRELGKAVSVIGIPGMPPGKAKIVGVESLGANILCRNHNSGLNDLDSAAVELFRVRIKIDESFAKPSLLQTTSKYQIDGILLERWILKVLAGLVLSGASENEGKKIKDSCSMNRELLINGLLKGRLPEGRGLSLAVGKNSITSKNELVCGMVYAWNDPMKIVGGFVSIRGQHFEVIFDPDAGVPPNDRVVRPTQLQFSDGRRIHQIYFKYKRPRVEKIVKIELENAEWLLRK